jgi:drug/metabolite transporter (DMT)-like permease
MGRFLPVAVLVALGAGWGLTQPLTKIAVSTGHQPFALLFWQQAIVAVLMGLACLATGRRLPLGRGALAVYAVIALLGAVLPGTVNYTTARHLPAGILSLLLSLVPMFAFPIALALGMDRFSLARLAGLGLGLTGVALIALPGTSLPDPAMAGWIPLALIPAMLYACEGNYVARFGTAGMDPLQVLTGASILGAAVTLPLAAGFGQTLAPPWPLGLPELALVLSALVHGVVYATYVWLVGRTGAVFAAQTSYLVTAFGVVWAMLLLGERYSLWVWAAFGVMLLGLTLVRPRPPADAAGGAAIAPTAARVQP